METLVLSREQALHLQELGLDMSDAKMCWTPYWNKIDEEDVWLVCIMADNEFLREQIKKGLSKEIQVIPTYTLQEILEKLPDYIETNKRTYCLFVDFEGGSVYYQEFDDYNQDILHEENYTELDLKTSAYKMLCWVIENGFLKVK